MCLKVGLWEGDWVMGGPWLTCPWQVGSWECDPEGGPLPPQLLSRPAASCCCDAKLSPPRPFLYALRAMVQPAMD